VYAYRKHVENVPLYFALGELAPAAKEVIFDATIRPMIEDTYDVTYVEYYRRGLEDLPEEAGPIMDWMEKQVREPAPEVVRSLLGPPERRPVLRPGDRGARPGAGHRPRGGRPAGQEH
jgi:hypothetical protein